MYTAMADVHCLAGVLGPDCAPAVNEINALQAMYKEDAFKPMHSHTALGPWQSKMTFLSSKFMK